MDRRERKTKKAIRDAFLQLLTQKPVGQITVTEISNAADLGRGTFYLHYKDVYDLHGAIENELCDSFMQMHDTVHPSTEPTHIKDFLFALTEYVDENRDLLLLLSSSGSPGSALFHKLRKLFYERLLEELAEPQENVQPDALRNDAPVFNSVTSMFFVSGVMGVMEEWLDDDLKMPQREIAEMLYMLILRLC